MSAAPVLVAPDKFKGTFTATEVAAAIAAGLRDGGREAIELPVADGGEGTAESLGGRRMPARAEDALGREVDAAFHWLDEGQTALVEASEASGLWRIGDGERDAWAASSAGTGRLIAAALEAGAGHVVVGCGGTASVDGGAGMLSVVGRPRRVKFTALCDARTPWDRAAEVFGPQKGASPAQVAQLAARLDEQANAMRRDPRGVPMTGCGGGISGALWSELGAELVPGPAYVLDALDFDEHMRSAAFVITGEGKLDASTLAGKAVAEVATRCRQAGVWCHAVVGRDELDLFGKRVLDLASVHEAGDAPALREAGRMLA